MYERRVCPDCGAKMYLVDKFGKYRCDTPNCPNEVDVETFVRFDKQDNDEWRKECMMRPAVGM